VSRRALAAAAFAALLAACGPRHPPAAPPEPPPATPAPEPAEPSGAPGTPAAEGIASWYGRPFHGRRTASGERFNQDALTAAHASFPFGSRVRVTNLDNGRSVVVRVNDRPGRRDRIIDLSRAAGRALGLVGPGTAPVRLELVR
jgi:rare lipoprotein A